MKGENNMTNRIFAIEEMENAFEIGRHIQGMIDAESIEVEDSKEVFTFALQLAMEFEKEYPETEDYYGDLEEFVTDKILNEFGVEE
jgi:hypothetical protein